jgi:hypothetical protein
MMGLRKPGEGSNPPDMAVCFFKTGRFLHFFLGPNECGFVIITTPAVFLGLIISLVLLLLKSSMVCIHL